jgi:hypothetical protein
MGHKRKTAWAISCPHNLLGKCLERQLKMSRTKQTNWVALLGKITHTTDGIKYIPLLIEEGPSQGQYSICLAKSNYDFENGSVSFTVKLKDPNNQVRVGFNHGTNDEIYAGISSSGSSYSISSFSNSKWEILASAGFGERPPIDEDVTVEIRVSGSRIDLCINRILVCTTYYKISPCQITLLMGGPKEMIVRNFIVHPQKPTAFIVMQFTGEFNALYNEVIRPTCEKYGLLCIRADDIYTTGLVLDDIVRSIQECFVIIADITPNNPNVFYEVGYAHGMGKATILLSDKKREKLPFDISGFRTLFYDNTIGGKTAIEDRLSKHLKSITNK